MTADLHAEFTILKKETIDTIRDIKHLPESKERALAALGVAQIWWALGQILISMQELLRDRSVSRADIDAALQREKEPILEASSRAAFHIEHLTRQ